MLGILFPDHSALQKKKKKHVDVIMPFAFASQTQLMEAMSKCDIPITLQIIDLLPQSLNYVPRLSV